LLQGDSHKKVIVDLAIPCDTTSEVIDQFNVKHISVSDLKEISEINLQRRIQEAHHVQEMLDEALTEFNKIYRERQVEVAMRAVPEKVREIRATAQAVFAKDLEALDPKATEVLEKMMAFMEKKYLSVPMKMAKEILGATLSKINPFIYVNKNNHRFTRQRFGFVASLSCESAIGKV